MSTALEPFVSVVRRSSLMNEALLEKALGVFRESGKPLTGEGFAEFLIQQDSITGWQAGKLLQGKHKGFFLGKYKLLRLLGKGGMSSVYLAEHVVMRRRSAIKVLPWKLVKDSSYLERFHREAQAVAALDHPNIVRAYDIDHEKDGNLEIHFLVMEYVEGRNLYDLVQLMGPLPCETVADYIRQGALGLEHAHAAGMVHRDVKPGNFIVDQHGTVKLMDLGLARVAAEDGDHSLTIAHDERVLGTADYLAPEQAVDSHQVDTRADIYSLGCTMYFLLVGRPPFHEGTLTQRLLAHQTKEPTPVSQIRKDVPDSLLAILQNMMKKDRDERIQTASEVVQLMTQWLTQQSGSSPGKIVPAIPPPLPHETTAVTAAEMPTPGNSDLHREPDSRKSARNNPELGDFLSSLSDLNPEPQKQPSSLKPAKSDSRLPKTPPKSGSRLPQKPSPPVADRSGPAPNPTGPLSPSLAVAGPRSANPLKQAPRPAAHVAPAGELLPADEDEFLEPAEATLLERLASIPKNRLAVIIGTVMIGLVLLVLALSLFMPRQKSVARTAANAAAPGTNPATPQAPAAPVRPEVTGNIIQVGPAGNFATVAEAIQFIRQAGPSGTLAPYEIQIAGDLMLNESIAIDNSGLGGFPRGIKITGTAEKPARLAPQGTGPVVTLDSVEGLTLQNLVIVCTGRAQGVLLKGFMSGTKLNNVRFENVASSGLEGVGASGLVGQPLVVENCRFQGTSPSGSGIRFTPSSGSDTRDVIVRGSRFLGPLRAGIDVQGSSGALEFRQNLFHECASGILFDGSEQQLVQIQFVNNTFSACENGIQFASGPVPSAARMTFEQNLFIGGSGTPVAVSRNGVKLEDLTRGTAGPRFNWTDRKQIDPASGLNIFAKDGKLGAEVAFVSDDPSNPNFLKPASKDLNVPAATGAAKYIGARAP